MTEELQGNLLYTVKRTLVELNERGYGVAVKRRDRREPARREKEELDARITAIVYKAFRVQRRKLIDKMNSWWGDQKKKPGTFPQLINFDDIFDDDAEFAAEMTRAIAVGMIGGVNLLQQMINVGVDYTLTNDRAYQAAADYAYDLVRNINDTSRDAITRAITSFVDTPGMTIGDIMDRLPFGSVRAEKIAVTEVTRAYATGERIAGEDLQKEFPNMKIGKTWYTNNDDRVCEVCGPLDGKTVGINEEFDSGISDPPAHVNCRCWDSVSTEI